MEPILFLPGMMCDARLFAPQIDGLSRERIVTVCPLTQHDRIEDMALAIIAHAPPKFALAGLSMGGIVAMEIMRRVPGRVTHLALMDTNAAAETASKAAEREPQIVGARAGRLEQIMRDEMKPQYLADTPYRTAILDLVLDMAMGLGPEVFVRQSRALQRRRDQQKPLGQITCPTLVLCGAEDTLCPPKRHAFMAEFIRDAQLRVVDGAGHLPTLEQPQAVTDALRELLAR